MVDVPAVVASSVRYAPGASFKWKTNALQHSTGHLLPEQLAYSTSISAVTLW